MLIFHFQLFVFHLIKVFLVRRTECKFPYTQSYIVFEIFKNGYYCILVKATPENTIEYYKINGEYKENFFVYTSSEGFKAKKWEKVLQEFTNDNPTDPPILLKGDDLYNLVYNSDKNRNPIVWIKRGVKRKGRAFSNSFTDIYKYLIKTSDINERAFKNALLIADNKQDVLLSVFTSSSFDKERKPSKYGLKHWADSTMITINLIKAILNGEDTGDNNELLQGNSYQTHVAEMQAANFPENDYNPYPFYITPPKSWHMDKKYKVVKGKYYVFKSYDIADCVNYINSMVGNVKKAKKQSFSGYKSYATNDYYITPKGKSGIKLISGLTLEEAKDYLYNKTNELEKRYNELRTFPNERRDWNRPRQSIDNRYGLDISPEKFASEFPFRGVEFGNWVNQLERAACLNEAYDALSDLAMVLATDNMFIALNGTLALAFGARGSGNHMAHYEPLKRVINLTKTKGAGCLAHEWFHALDHYIGLQNNLGLTLSTEFPNKIENTEVSAALHNLCQAICKLDYYKRAQEIDKYRSKKYWSTIVELAARAFEKYVESKLAAKGFDNDYLVNIKSVEDYNRKECYPYPLDEENSILSPLFDKLIECVLTTGIVKAA